VIDITQIIGIVITLIGAIVSAFVIPYIKARTTASQREQIQAWVNIAVAAYEQLIQGDKKGAERKAAVLVWLNERGVTVDTDEIDAMIEAAVYKLK